MITIGCSTLLAALLQVSVAAPLPVEEEPRHRTRLETGQVRVLDFTLPPGDISLLHRHSHDLAYVALTSGTIWTESELGERQNVKLTAGDVRSNTDYSDRPRAHQVGNSGKTPFHLVAVEFLNPPGFEKGPLVTGNPHGFEKALEDENGIVYRLRLKPGESTGPHQHPRPAVLVRFPDGALQWIEEGSPHELHNPTDASSASILYIFAIK
jgi:quercetin dioxygenase-like cupin family protein